MSWFCTYFICKLPVCLSRISYKPFFSVSVVVVLQSLSCVQHFAIPWTAASQASLSFTFSWNLLKFLSVESVMLSNYLILCRPLLLMPSIFPSIRVFSSESALHIRWPKYWSFSISPSNEYSELIFQGGREVVGDTLGVRSVGVSVRRGKKCFFF